MSSETISSWLWKAAKDLRTVGIDSARLDAEVILAHTLRKPRTWLHAHNDEPIDARRQSIADTRIELRRDHTPIAYIIGHKEFYGRPYRVTPSVLIPRPDSEVLIDLLKKYRQADQKRLTDVGTGSGCVGITAKLELPDLTVLLCDISRHALIVARRNATELRAEVDIVESDLLPPGYISDIIIANLPYVDSSWQRNRDTDYEPELALFAEDDGLELIKQLIDQTSSQIDDGGLLILEADPRQHAALIAYATQSGFDHLETIEFGVALQKRNTLG